MKGMAGGTMKGFKLRSLEARKGMYGRVFILPWVIGFILFFAVPLLQSIIFSFSKITLSTKGFITKFIGLDNYAYALQSSQDFQTNLKDDVNSFDPSLLIIVVLSLILAVVLNQKFKGRLIARAVFFLPVIIATGVVMQILNQDIIATQLRNNNTDSNNYLYASIDFVKVLMNMGLPDNIVSPVIAYLNQIFNLIWNCGVQIILFLAGLQSIPDQLYEVSKVEGATAWEEFWMITLPMMSNILVLVIIYTMIDLFTNAGNPVMDQAYQLMLNQQNFDQSSAMLWSYFSIVGLFIAAVLFIVNHFFIKRWE